MTQEKIMKKRMIRAIVAFILTFIAMLVFIGLYVDETRRVQETYRKQYRTSLTRVVEDIESYLNSEGDLDLRYTRIISDMSAANSFAFLLNDFENEQKIINELHTCIMKYPEQMPDHLEDMEKALNDVLADLGHGYAEVSAVVAAIDKMGH